MDRDGNCDLRVSRTDHGRFISSTGSSSSTNTSHAHLVKVALDVGGRVARMVSFQSLLSALDAVFFKVVLRRFCTKV